jgi:Flp pilus assembly protein TadD
MIGRSGEVCTTTLVSSKVVLTAAHCVNAGAGTAYVPRGIGFGRSLADNLEIPATAAFVLPTYDEAHAFEDDLGMIVLKQRAPFMPVPLHDEAPRVGENVILVGYGRTNPDSQEPFGRKMKVTEPITQVTPDGIRVAQSVCNGDSGGPALIEVDGVEEIAGVISYGDSCRTYGVSQRVDLHRAWIDLIVAQNDPPSCERDFRCLDTCPTGDADCPCLATDRVCSALCTDPASDPDCPRGCGAGDSCISGSTCPAPDPDCGDPCGAEGHCIETCTTTRDPDCPAPKPTGSACTRNFDCASPASCIAAACQELCDPTRPDACASGEICKRLTAEAAVCLADPDGGEGGCSAGGRSGSPWLLLALVALLARRRWLALFLFVPVTGLAAPPSPALAAGDAAFGARRYHEAARAYEKAAADDADDTVPRYRLGVALAAAGDLPRAVAAWESVLVLDPVHELARRNLDLARLRLPVPPAPDARVVLARARVLLDEGRAASALVLLDAVPSSAETLALRAEAHIAAGEPAAALASARALLALEPDSPRPLGLFAAAHRLSGDAARARYFGDLQRARE